MSRMNETPAPRRRIRPVALSVIALVVALVVVQSALAAGAVSLTTLGAPYMENFDTLATSGTTNSSLPNGWWLAESGTNANGLYQAGTGSGNAGDTYSFGAASSPERALGGLQSGSLNPTIGAAFTNDTGSTVTTLAISYTGEQWRLGTLNRADRIDFQYSLDATSLTTGTWTDVDALDFAAPTTGPTVGVLDGNTAANRAAVSGQISGISVASGGSFWIRWISFDASGADDGLAVDDFSLTPSVAEAAPSVLSTAPASNATDVPVDSSVSITFSEPVSVSTATFTISCATSGAHTFTLSGAPASYTLDPDTDFVVGETCTVTVDDQGVKDVDTNDPPDTMAVDRIFSFTTTPLLARIYEVQGASHVSPLVGRTITAPGVITSVRPNSFTMQDGTGDGNVATSDAILVFATGIGGSVSVGQAVTVSGRVTEFRPGGAASANLSTTEITSPAVTPGGPGVAIARTVIGVGGRVPPSSVIDDDATGDVETSGSFDPATDGIDFYESLEGMRVQRRTTPSSSARPTASARSGCSQTTARGAGIRTARRASSSGPTDFNPERIQLDDDIVLDATPDANVGDHFTGRPRRRARLQFRQLQAAARRARSRGVDGGLAARGRPRPRALRTSSRSPPSTSRTSSRSIRRRSSRGWPGLIVDNLRSPDVVAVEEIQDNNGPTDIGRHRRDADFGQLIAAIQAAGGPGVPVPADRPGGRPGRRRAGRQHPRRASSSAPTAGLAFVDRPGATSTTPTASRGRTTGVQLVYSPGRIDPHERGLGRQPQAARGRVPLPRQDRCS